MRQAGRHGAALTLALALAALGALLLPPAASAEPPAVSVDPVGSASIVTAHVSGTVDANEIGTEWFFEVSAEGGEWTRTNLSGSSSGPDPEVVEGTLEGLKAGTSYELRLTAYNFEEFANVSSSAVLFETDPAVAPILALDPATGVGATAAHISGSIDPEGGNEDADAGLLPIQWELQLNREGNGWNTVGSGALTGADAESTTPIAVEADPSGLIPNSHYEFRILVRYAGLERTSADPPSSVPNGEFDTEAIKPDIDRETLWNPTSTSIQLNAKVNAHNSVLTDCHFEYGPTTAYGSTVPCEAKLAGDTYAAPDDNSDHVVSARLPGLQPSTTYHFRLVAANGTGETQGDDRSFTTLGEPATESCSNQTIRIAQHSTNLPDCRAFEKVSPADKGNGDIVGDGATTVAAKAGDAVAFNSRTPFGDTVGSGTIGQTQYVARRTAQGWGVHGVTPTPRPDAKQTFFGPTILQIYSDDLRAAVVRGYDLPAATDDTPLRNSLYVEDTATRALRTVTVSQVEVPAIPDFLNWPLSFWGISADARHVAFVTPTQFLPDAAPGVPNVYQWDDGVLRVANVLPDGTVPAEGADTPENLRGAMSADGSRLLFTASTGGNPQLFMRIDAARTAWVSETELDPSDPSYQPDPSNVRPLGMTPDGRSAFFTTESRLLEEDENDGTDLYRYTDSADPSGDDNLKLISQDGDLAGAQLVGMSDDGERVYYQTPVPNLVVWDHGTSRLLSTVVSFGGSGGSEGLGLTGAIPGYGRVTSDGMFLAFGTKDGLTGEVTNGHRELYLYSLRDDTLRCVSCPSDPATSDATVLPEATQGNPTLGNAGFRPRFLSESGRVFFSSGDPLVARDTNGVLDTYEYDPVTGRVSLLSTGKGKDPATFADASGSGDDVFIVSRQRLVASDRDELVDLYDVGVNRGLPEPEEHTVLPCEGDGCQSAPAAPPAAPRIGSSAAAAGNLHRQTRCARNQRKVRRKGKVRCVARHHKHKRANTNRRAGR